MCQEVAGHARMRMLASGFLYAALLCNTVVASLVDVDNTLQHVENLTRYKLRVVSLHKVATALCYNGSPTPLAFGQRDKSLIVPMPPRIDKLIAHGF